MKLKLEQLAPLTAHEIIVDRGFMPDSWIKQMAYTEKLIYPFIDESVKEVSGTELTGKRKVLSYGLGPYGYDLTLSKKSFKIYNGRFDIAIDPKRFNPGLLADAELRTEPNGESWFEVPGNSYALGVTAERLIMPNDVSGLIIGKSTYARSGLIVNCTTIEAGWRGYPTLEFSNSAPSKLRVYASEGIAQIHFIKSDKCETPYAEKGGIYQDQQHEVTTPRI